KLETFAHDKTPIRMYTCGPTVYDSAHIGNLRSFLFADIARRSLVFDGYDVDWVMNITDVDDKTIKQTVEEFGDGATVAHLREVTDRHTEKFKQDLAALSIPLDVIRFVHVSDVMDDITQFIEELIDKGFAYQADDGSWYFSIEKYQAQFGDYGLL